MKRLLALSVLFFATYTPEAHATGTCNADVTVTNHASASTTGSIAYCISSLVAQGGGTVNLARGTYYTQGAIALQDGVNIVGVGRSGSVIAYNGTGAHDILTTSGRTVDNVTLRYFTVRGTNTSGQTGIPRAGQLHPPHHRRHLRDGLLAGHRRRLLRALLRPGQLRALPGDRAV